MPSVVRDNQMQHELETVSIVKLLQNRQHAQNPWRWSPTSLSCPTPMPTTP